MSARVLQIVKTIVIAGAHSNVGKTRLACQIQTLLQNAVYIKIGHGTSKEGKQGVFYHTGTPFDVIRSRHENADYLIIESNSILTEITPACTVYLTGEPQKPSAIEAQKKADIIKGSRITKETVEQLRTRLGLPQTIIHKIIWFSGARPVHTTAIILAGGKSSRMGRDKASLDINGKQSLIRLRQLLAPYFDEIIVSVNREKAVSLDGVRIVRDNKDGQGPLMGIYSALRQSHSATNFIIACDIPNVNMTLLFELLSQSEDHDIAVPSFTQGEFEPLFAVYTKHVVPAAQKLLEAHRRRIACLFEVCETAVVSSSDNAWYVNLNTPDDYRNYCKNAQPVAGGQP